MAGRFVYDKIIKYIVTAVCTQPLHIGSAVGDKQEVLVHPLDDVPFVQAASIRGVFRSYCKEIYGLQITKELFGAEKLDESNEPSEYGSRIRFEDGIFLNGGEKLSMELRPHVRIDAETGTCQASFIKGSGQKAGHKFNVEYIGAGAKIGFVIYLFGEDYQENVEMMLSGIDSEAIQFGGKKSNGCGYMRIEKILSKSFDMRNPESRKLWYEEDCLDENFYEDRTRVLKQQGERTNAYEVVVEGRTENQLLVKSIAVSAYGKEAPKAENMKNTVGEYIIPGSSWKGAVKSQMKKIALYMKHTIDAQCVMDNAFGTEEGEHEEKKAGNLCFYDTYVGEKEENDQASLSYRIHIDKFTGGVMHGSLFSEKNVSGTVRLRISIRDKNYPEQTCALLIMALRDLAIGTVNIGSGYSVGKGFIDVDKICIMSPKSGKEAVIDMKRKSVEDPDAVLTECFTSLRKMEENDGI